MAVDSLFAGFYTQNILMKRTMFWCTGQNRASAPKLPRPKVEVLES